MDFKNIKSYIYQEMVNLRIEEEISKSLQQVKAELKKELIQKEIEHSNNDENNDNDENDENNN